MVVSSMAISRSIEKCGLSFFLGEKIIEIGIDVGDLFMLNMVFFLSTMFSSVLSPGAVLGIMYPILRCIDLQGYLRYSFHQFLYVSLQAGCNQFLTPINRKNQMVALAGGYKFLDWAKLGIPLTFLNWLVTMMVVILVLPHIWEDFKK